MAALALLAFSVEGVLRADDAEGAHAEKALGPSARPSGAKATASAHAHYKRGLPTMKELMHAMEVEQQAVTAGMGHRHPAAGTAAHHDRPRRGLPSMKELMRARQAAQQLVSSIGSVQLDAARASPPSPSPIAAVEASSHQREQLDYTQLESQAIASANKILQEAKAKAQKEEVRKAQQEAVVTAAAKAAEVAAKARATADAKKAAAEREVAMAAVAVKAALQLAQEGAVVKAAAEAKAADEATAAEVAKAAAVAKEAAFRHEEEAVAKAASEARAAAHREREQAAAEMVAARAAVKTARAAAHNASEQVEAELARAQALKLAKLIPPPPPPGELTRESLQDPPMEVLPSAEAAVPQQQKGPRLSDCDCSWAHRWHGRGGASCNGQDDGSTCWKACCNLPRGKTFAISLAAKASTAPTYTAKDCDCGWASHDVCTASKDDGSVCWGACCTRYLSVQEVEQQQSTNAVSPAPPPAPRPAHPPRPYWHRNTTKQPPPPPPPAGDDLRRTGESCLDACLGGPGVCPQHCGQQGACCRSDVQDTFLHSVSDGGAACRADDGSRLGCVGGHCCVRSATKVPTLELDNEGVSSPLRAKGPFSPVHHLPSAARPQEVCWAPCSERAGGCPGFCGSDGACCRRGDSGHADGVACNHGASGCTGEHCCVYNAMKVRWSFLARSVPHAGRSCFCLHTGPFMHRRFESCSNLWAWMWPDLRHTGTQRRKGGPRKEGGQECGITQGPRMCGSTRSCQSPCTQPLLPVHRRRGPALRPCLVC